MPFGFGGSPGAPIPPEPRGDVTDRLLRAIENLSSKVAPPLSGGYGFELWQPITLPAIGNTVVITSQNDSVTMLTVQVFAGEVAIMLGDFGGSSIPPVPFADLAVVGVPVHIPLGTRPREVTFWAKAANTSLSAYLHSPAH
jgi:hypothetical protein